MRKTWNMILEVVNLLARELWKKVSIEVGVPFLDHQSWMDRI